MIAERPQIRRRLTVGEYERLVEQGVFTPEQRLELLEGEIIEKMPQGPAHATAVDCAAEVCHAAFGERFRVRVQLPLTLAGVDSVPEPDLAIVQGSARDFAQAHPTTAALVVEVADTTLETDRTTKAALYARSGIEEYWVINLNARALEVRRGPVGEAWGSERTLSEGEAISPLAAPGRTIRVAELLP